jgi:hypothetical protein
VVAYIDTTCSQPFPCTPLATRLFFWKQFRRPQTLKRARVRSIGVLSVLTEAGDGVSWRTFVEGLRQFNARR